MRIIDVDAHLHEPLDWVQQTDGELAEELGPPARENENKNYKAHFSKMLKYRLSGFLGKKSGLAVSGFLLVNVVKGADLLAYRPLQEIFGYTHRF